MALTFGLLSVRDLFPKLKRDADLLNAEVTSDRLFNFVVTSSIRPEIKARTPRFLSSGLRSEVSFAAAQQISSSAPIEIHAG